MLYVSTRRRPSRSVRYPPSSPKTPPAIAGTKNSIRAHCTYRSPPGSHCAIASGRAIPPATICSTSGALSAAIAGLMISGSISSS